MASFIKRMSAERRVILRGKMISVLYLQKKKKMENNTTELVIVDKENLYSNI